MKIDVLDHGFVRLVSYMQPVPHGIALDGDAVGRDVREWTGDLEIVRNARVSYNADWRAFDAEPSKDEKLIHYMMKHGHTTPFEAMVFTFEVQAPIFVFRQWHRHRTWSYNEVSARYTEMEDLFYVPSPAYIGVQSKSNKQGRGEKHEYAEAIAQDIERISRQAHFIYRQLLEGNVSRELARLVLPLNTYSRMFATVDLHNLFHFLELRLDEHAQFEIRMYAQALLDLIAPICPVAVDAFRQKVKTE